MERYVSRDVLLMWEGHKDNQATGKQRPSLCRYSKCILVSKLSVNNFIYLRDFDSIYTG